RVRPDGNSVGILLERSRWIADLIAVLPDDRKNFDSSSVRGTRIGSNWQSNGFVATGIGSIALVDEAKRTIYRWGDVEDFKLPPLHETGLSSPLASWQLRLHVNDSLLPDTSPVPMYFSLAGIGLVLLAVGFYVLTSVQRQIADAKSRVSFAGQVSHELRTPLTNIRLYTELAESDLKQLEPTSASSSLAKRLEVIDHESRRLQRLVSGVLEMIRPSGKRVGLRKSPTDVCQLVAGIADQFKPSFEAAGLTLESNCSVGSEICIDADILEMVIVNLLSNVEKYVPRGGRCSINCDIIADSKTGAEQMRVIVDDDGPGIAGVHRSRVFRPFIRIDDSISAPSGTGIGLTIALRAARRHGGDLILLTSSTLGGAAFQLTLPIDEKN
ncbi:MAG: HAMP domain-containing histidine kinase, partial [Planctomycetales bacterium]|nr:HAMP domain-containing histidine kinase [Planctomycetales bacterium]